MLRQLRFHRHSRWSTLVVLAVVCAQFVLGTLMPWRSTEQAIASGQLIEVCSGLHHGVVLVTPDGQEAPPPHQQGGAHCPFCLRDDFLPLQPQAVAPVAPILLALIDAHALTREAPVEYPAPPARKHAPPHAPPVFLSA
jgi:hypothetical protein